MKRKNIINVKKLNIFKFTKIVEDIIFKKILYLKCVTRSMNIIIIIIIIIII